MLCENCGQRPAIIHVTKLQDGVTTEKHLCAECASEQGGLEFALHPFQVSGMLSGFLAHIHGTTVQEEDLRCGTCGMMYSEFASSGRFGCGACYEAFGPRLLPLLRRVHGSVEHKGKIPLRRGSEFAKAHEKDTLKQQLEDAVKREAYEEAAALRDRIKELERGSEMR
jgi:protein arginine kinase activator